MRTLAVCAMVAVVTCGTGDGAKQRVLPSADAGAASPVEGWARSDAVRAAPARRDTEPIAAAASLPAGDPDREHVREILGRACGMCHIAPISEDPRALEIFDLTDDDFAARMTDSALESMAVRTENMEVSPAERDTVLSYFSALLNERRFAVPRAGDC